MNDTKTARILIVEDDKGVVYTLTKLFKDMGHSVKCCSGLAQSFETVVKDMIEIVFLDVHLPDGSGMDLLERFQKLPSPPLVIVMTGFADPDDAERAIQNGAWDYLEKPFSVQKITLQLMRALQYRKKRSNSEEAVLLKREGILGESPAIQSCISIAARAAGCDASVLILGATGTGKELFARAIHENSTRAHENFVVVDCGIMTETLVESMLFGHTKGAFTGADREQMGLVRIAHKGTLFLDEVGELPLSAQASFLRVLQEHRFRPVGGKEEVESDFRLIAATNRDLEAMVEQNKFRRDLFFRLRAISLDLPPLKGRKDDIKALVVHYITVFCDRYGLDLKGFSPDFLETLQAYPWPGNTRELINAVDSSIAMAHNEPTLFSLHLPKRIRIHLARKTFKKKDFPSLKSDEERTAAPVPRQPFVKLRELIENTEKDYFKALVSETRGDIKNICEISGLSRAMVYARLKKYHISRTS